MKLRYVRVLLLGTTCIMALGATEQDQARNITRYARFQVGDQIAYGIVENDQVRLITGDMFGYWELTDQIYKLSEVKLLVPTEPSKVLAMIGNYQSHLDAGRTPAQPSTHPGIFIKLPSSLLPDGATL